MNRKREQADFVFKLGQLLGPPIKMAESPGSFDADERTRILARYFADMPRFLQEFQIFCGSEPGHSYIVQLNQVQHALYRIQTQLSKGTEEELHKTILRSAEQAKETILSIPVPIDSTIHEASTPFSTYSLVKDLCSTVKLELVWLDRYFDQTIFHRFFGDTPKTAQVTLVTQLASSLKSKGDQQRQLEFMDISRLFAQERGPSGYRLIETQNFHDRWLRCDDRLFALGGSIKDLGRASTFTISKIDSTSNNMKHFDDAVKGAEIFGPNQTSHS